MSQYLAGTASVTNGSATVTGSGTLWSANVSAADSFTIAGDGVMYDVASVDSDTQVTLSAPYAGTTASGVVYAIGTGFTVPDSFPEMSQGDIETATIFTRAMRTIQSKFSGIVSDISGKADKDTTYTKEESPVDNIFISGAIDINGVVKSGFYLVSTNSTNNPVGDTALMIVSGSLTNGENRVYQQITSDTGGPIFYRTKNEVDNFTEWKQFVDLSGANFTAMPQVGGDPIVESGTNSNGAYTKFADGTMICLRTYSIQCNSLGSGSLTNMYRSFPFNWTFPVSFVGNPVLSSTAQVSAGGANGFVVSNSGAAITNTSSSDIQMFRGTDIADLETFHLQAIGRWL